MHGLREPSFFSKRKKDEGRIMPALSESEIYLFMARDSGADKEYNLHLGGVVPGSKSILQS